MEVKRNIGKKLCPFRYHITTEKAKLRSAQHQPANVN